MEAGFTLVEMIVTVAIMLIIVTPLASAMIIGFRVTDQSGANLQASLNRDEATTRWAADVGSVDATGVSYTTTRACGANGPGTLYVTFNSTKLSSAAVTTVRRVSYWITGAGIDLAFERRECSGPVATISLTNYRSTIVADQIGTDPGGTSLIFPPNGSGTDPCTEFMCGANLVGRYSFELRAPRRAFGVGTPLEIGTLYSSAFTRQGGTDQSFRYVHYTTVGTAGLIEQLYDQQLSLAPGLGSNTEMAVDFKVQQRTTGKWMVRNTITNQLEFSTTPTWIPASYSSTTEQWALTGINAGSDTDGNHQYGVFSPGTIDAGGEYRVFTQITERSSTGGALTPKQYGGANGFPMWFDWRPDQVVFVSKTAGNDANDGRADPNTGLPKPVKTIARGLAVARDKNTPLTPGVSDAPVPEVLIQADRYPGQIQANTGNTADHTTLQGGLTANWLRAGPNSISAAPDTRPRLAAIDGSQVSSILPSIGMVIDGVSDLRIRQLEVNSSSGSSPDPTGGSAAAQTTFGMQVRNGAKIEVQSSTIAAKAPPNWTPSSSTVVPSATVLVACSGIKGGLHSSSNNTGAIISTGAPGANLLLENNCTTAEPSGEPRSRRGGYGGAGGTGGTFCSGGSNGANGGKGGTSSTGGAAGGDGGAGGSRGCDPGDGERGQGGLAGSGGTQTTPLIPAATSSQWVPPAPTKGGDGTAGGGGGGSGGGGGNQTVSATGRSGSSGGSGGKAGVGGAGGQSGGSAIGLYIWDASTTVRFVNTGISTATGYKGEAGAPGTRGGSGGSGGSAFVGNATDFGGDTAGAGGGGGGGGGAGGNGGNGGNSIGVFLGSGVTASQVTRGTVGATGVTATTNPPDWSYFLLGGGGPAGVGGTVAPTSTSPPSAAGGAGAGGPGGDPNSSCSICFNLFNTQVQIGYYSAAGGEYGSAGTAAAAGRNGTAGTKCWLWTWDSSGGSCTNSTGV